jgi:hypothetical protein
MIRDYAITNFKAFAGQQRVKLRPITLIYGQNSSGKSSLLQSLLLLKQTIESSENPELLLLPKGNLVDLGGFREFINAHDVRKPFAFEVVMPIPKSERFFPNILLRPLEASKVETIGLRVELVYDSNSSAATLHSLALFLGEHPEALFSFKSEHAQARPHFTRRFAFSGPRSSGGVMESVLRLSSLNQQHPFWVSVWEAVHALIDREALNSLNRRREFLAKRLERVHTPELAGIEEETKRPAEKRLERQLKDIDSTLDKLKRYTQRDLLNEIEKQTAQSILLCRNFLPVGMIREERDGPKGVFGMLEEFGGIGYDLATIAGLTIFAANGLQASLEGTIYIGPLRDYPERHYIFSGNLTEQVGKSGKMVPDVLFKRRDLLEQVNQQLEAFGLGYELKVSSVNDRDSDLQDVFALRLFDKRTQIHASILDVGFGISQVLPIVVQSMLSRGKTLCVEQPEIHLHPRLQADLGTLVAMCAKEPFSNQFIIETHSQHLILRLQKLVRQGKLTPQDISVIYVDRTSVGSQCVELRLDKDGDFIDKWPQGFFEEGYSEIFS